MTNSRSTEKMSSNVLIVYLTKHWDKSFTTTHLATVFDFSNEKVNEMLIGCEHYGIEKKEMGPGDFSYSCTTEKVMEESVQMISLGPRERSHRGRGRGRQHSIRSPSSRDPPDYFEAWQPVQEPPPRAAASLPRLPSDQHFINLKEMFTSSRIMKVIIIDLNNVSGTLTKLIGEKQYQIHGFGNTEYKGLGSAFIPFNHPNYKFWCTKTSDKLEAYVPVVFALWAAHEAKVDLVKVYSKNRTIRGIAEGFQYMIPCHTVFEVYES